MPTDGQPLFVVAALAGRHCCARVRTPLRVPLPVGGLGPLIATPLYCLVFESQRPTRVPRGRRGRLAIAGDVLGRPALVLSRSNRVLTLLCILLGTVGALHLCGGERAQWREPPMPADPAAAHSDDRSKYCLSLARHRAASGECGRVARISRRHRTNTLPTPSIRYRASAVRRPSAEPGTAYFPAPRHHRPRS